MASFSDLPNELVSEIWTHLLYPEDIESFALVSHAIRTLGKPTLKRHLELRSEYSYLTNIDGGGWIGQMLAPLLKIVLLNPHIGHYVKKLGLETYVYEWEEDEDGVTNSLAVNREPHYFPDGTLRYVAHSARTPSSYDDDDRQIFIQAMRSAAFIPCEDYKAYETAIDEGDEEPLLAMLLQYLPSLRSLDFFEPYHEKKILYPVVERMTRLGGIAAFSGLQTINFHCIATHRTSIKMIGLFLNLPSLRSLTLHGFLSFTYKRHGHTNSRQDLFFIRLALLASAQSSLEELTILTREKTAETDPRPVGSLRLFKTLRTLEVDYDLVLGYSDDQSRFVAETFPDSIERIFLWEYRAEEAREFSTLVHAFIEAKQSRYCKLTRLGIQTSCSAMYDRPTRLPPPENSPSQELIKLCNQHDIALQFRHY